MRPEAEAHLRRVILAVAVGAFAAFFSYHAQRSVVIWTDFAQIWHASRALLAGHDPYLIVGPGRPFDWPFPLLYPLTALIPTAPLALLPLPLASALFVGIGSGGLAWALGTDATHAPGRWFVFVSASYVSVVRTAQWAPLLMASGLSSWAGFLLACKPSTGLALFAAYPSWPTALGAAAITGVAVAVAPGWPSRWLATLPSAHHMSAPVTYLTAGGPLIMLALMRWRQPEARLLVALACIPHTTLLYEALPLFLIVRRWQEGAALTALSWSCMCGPVSPDYLEMMHTMGWRMTALLYLPCALLVLARRDRPEDDIAWTSWPRGAVRR